MVINNKKTHGTATVVHGFKNIFKNSGPGLFASILKFNVRSTRRKWHMSSVRVNVQYGGSMTYVNENSMVLHQNWRFPYILDQCWFGTQIVHVLSVLFFFIVIHLWISFWRTSGFLFEFYILLPIFILALTCCLKITKFLFSTSGSSRRALVLGLLPLFFCLKIVLILYEVLTKSKEMITWNHSVINFPWTLFLPGC